MLTTSWGPIFARIMSMKERVHLVRVAQVLTQVDKGYGQSSY